MIVFSALYLGFTKVQFELYDNGNSKLETLFSCFRLSFNFIAASFLYIAITLIGLSLFVIPGVIWSLQYGFYGYDIVNKNSSPIEALKNSSKMSQGVKWDLFALSLLQWVITFVSGGIGLIITIPAAGLTYTYIYRKLEKRSLSSS